VKIDSIVALAQNNTAVEVAIAAAAAALTFLVLRWSIAWIGRRLKTVTDRTERWWDDVVTETIGATHPLVLIYIGIYVAMSTLEVPDHLVLWLNRGLVIAIGVQFGLWGNRAASSWARLRSAEAVRRGETAGLASLGIFCFIAQFALWTLIVLLLLDNLGFNVTALVASLGIGGVAIALAIQNILGDLFASLSIATDKPFRIGDFITIDTHMGTVKHVGLKTTRLQSLGGEELVFSNADLLKSRIRNYKRMSDRRIEFKFSLAYGTRAGTVDDALRIVRAAIEALPRARFDHVHFMRFGDTGLEFEAVYYVLDPDYNKSLDTQQGVLLQMLGAFEAAGIQFAPMARAVRQSALTEALLASGGVAGDGPGDDGARTPAASERIRGEGDRA
jgi:small-conductance mechanosensitive channel